eukprot:66523-Pleurochrysis_carterae.AAC.2
MHARSPALLQDVADGDAQSSAVNDAKAAGASVRYTLRSNALSLCSQQPCLSSLDAQRRARPAAHELS